MPPELGDRQRLAEEKPHQITVVNLAQEEPLRIRFNALGHDRQMQMLRQTDDRGTEQCIGITVLDTRDEGLIDLQLIERQPGEVGQG